jgi:hypothetical protein
MVSCPKCGTKNQDDATFCTHCGEPLRSNVGSTIERHAKRFAQEMEQAGKRFGDHMSQAAKQIHDSTQEGGRRFEQRIDDATHRAENWYDRTFGVIGPLISSFIFLIVFRIAIAVLEIPSVETPEMNIVAVILLPYVLPLFAITLLSNYTQYLSRKYFQVRLFSPLLYAITVTLVFWIVSRILYDAGVRFTTADLLTAAASLEDNLPTIFVFVLLLGYIILVLNMPRDQGRKP